MGFPIGDDVLEAYLAERLPSPEMARVEKALRDSAELRHRLEDVRAARGDGGVHTLGAIWRRNRLTCPTRQELGSFLLDVLEPDRRAYLTFHLDVVECLYCQANLEDLKRMATAAAAAPETRARRTRIFDSSRDLLGSGG